MKDNFTSVVLGHLEYQLQVKKLKPLTVNDIRCSLRKVDRFCKAKGLQKDLWQLSLQEYIQWINWLQEQKQTAKSINKMLSHVRSLIDYAWQIEKVDRNVLDGFYLKEPETTAIYDQLTIEEAQNLVKAFGKISRTERRLRAVMLMLYGCGLRTLELCRLSVNDIDLDRQEVRVHGKGDKERVIPLSDPVFSELLVYLRDRNSKRGPLFRTEIKKTALGNKDVGDIVQMAVARAGLKKTITPRTLRHAFASHLLDQGVDIGVISMLMGHRSPSETGIYIHAQEKSLKAAVFKMTKESE
ncbi:MAG: tyrosine-type recombinase/integrase [Bdellovibrionaceae bacterium]|nr:tyrosine-type recombinase/integrase [Pseudobdellovibrionaceae bacterium]